MKGIGTKKPPTLKGVPMAASPKSSVSKTARSSSKTSGKARAVPAADIDRLVALNGGKYVYLYHPDGRSLKFKSDAPEFFFAVSEVCSMGFASRIKAQVARESAKHPGGPWTAMEAAFVAENVYGDEA